jgi:hypothetical protein
VDVTEARTSSVARGIKVKESGGDYPEAVMQRADGTDREARTGDTEAEQSQPPPTVFPFLFERQI